MRDLVNLKICLLGSAPAIFAILKQEGIASYEVKALTGGTLESCGIVLLGRTVKTPEKGAVKPYVLNGGTVIFDRTNESLLSELENKQLIHDSAETYDGITSYKSGNGYIIYIDEDLNNKFLNTDSMVKEFIFEAGLARERVARYPKFYLREMVHEALYLAHKLNVLPFIKFWYYPYGYRSVFNFRFDVDGDTKGDLELASDASRFYKDCTTWFVSCFAFEKKSNQIKNMITDGFNVESHGYFHHVYDDRNENKANIKKSNEYFDKLNYKPKGFAAPKGKWNRALQKVLEEENFLYSSEFSLDYDNIPFFPVVSGLVSRVLQIPIHPVCPELYIDSGMVTKDALSRYFERVILGKYDSCLPIFLYSHPNVKLSENLEVLFAIYQKIESLKDVWRTDLTNFALWWKNRYEQKIEGLFFDKATRTIKYDIAGSFPRGMAFCVCADKERYFLYQIQEKKEAIELDSLSEGACKELVGIKRWFPNERGYVPTFTGRMKGLVKEFIDWEEDTPLDSLKRRSVKENLKYYLRRLKSEVLR